MISPLNPALYNRLVARFGDVKIANEGAAFQGVVTSFGVKKRFNITNFGESYRICCPFCSKAGDPDKRHRLYINHRWGEIDKATGMRLWHIATCFHNDCMSFKENITELKHLVYGLKADSRLPSLLRQGHVEKVQQNYHLPGKTVLLDSLPDNHPAIQYIRERGFDPAELASVYKVCYCESAENSSPLAEGRIIVPVYMREKLVGWQGRYIGTPASKRIPKYYSQLRKSSVLYNYDQAIQYPLCIVVEGVFDVWAVGPGAVALFGCIASRTQLELLSQWDNIAIMLDPDQPEHIKQLYNTLSRKRRVFIVQLPENTDPGSLSRTQIWQAIYNSANDKNFPLLEILKTSLNNCKISEPHKELSRAEVK